MEALARFVSPDELTAKTRETIIKQVSELMADLGVRDDSKYHNVITKTMWNEIMSAWVMRFAERKHNLIVTMPSTPAQYFHVLRRQIHRPYAKPLVVMSASDFDETWERFFLQA